MDHRNKCSLSEIRVDKTKLLQQVIAQVEETLRRLGSGYAVAKQATLDAPHVMKSKREVTGIEASYLANALAGNIQERGLWLRTLKGLRLPEAPERVALGCVVGIGPLDGPVQHLYFILPVCGGMVIPLDDGRQSIRIVTPETPVASALIGKAIGEEVLLRRGDRESQHLRLLV